MTEEQLQQPPPGQQERCESIARKHRTLAEAWTSCREIASKYYGLIKAPNGRYYSASMLAREYRVSVGTIANIVDTFEGKK